MSHMQLLSFTKERLTSLYFKTKLRIQFTQCMKIMRLLRHGKKSKYLKYTTICMIIENELIVE